MGITSIVIIAFLILLGFSIYKTRKKDYLSTKLKGFRIGGFLTGGLLVCPLIFWNGWYISVLLSSNYAKVSDAHQDPIRLMNTIDLVIIGCAIILTLVLLLWRISKRSSD